MSPPSDDRLSDALLRPVRTGNAFEETMERMLQAIRLGVIGPGGRLPPERELSVRLRVSRVTLREALRVLQESGYVESRRGRYGGTFVSAVLPVRIPVDPPTGLAGELEDALTLRWALETGAAEAAASRRSAGRTAGSCAPASTTARRPGRGSTGARTPDCTLPSPRPPRRRR